MSGNLNHQNFVAGEILFTEGEPADRAYLIERGTVEITRINDENQVITLATVSRGEMVGEMALIETIPRTATARAIDEVSVIVVEKAEFDMRMARSDPVVRQLLRIFVDRLKKTTSKHVHKGSEVVW